MSLLMDALKKAEQAKRDAQGGNTIAPPGAGEGLSLAPSESVPAVSLAPLSYNVPLDAVAPAESAAPGSVDSARPSIARASAYPDLSAAMSVPDSEFLDISRIPSPAKDPADAAKDARNDVPARAAPPLPNAAMPATASAKPAAPRTKNTNSDRDAAGNVFAAKELGKSSGGNKTFAILIGIATITATAGIGGYFWWQLQPRALSTAAKAGNPPMQGTQPIAHPASPAPSLAALVQPPINVTAAANASNSMVTPASAVPSAPNSAPTTQTTPSPAKAIARNVEANDDEQDSPVRVTKNQLQVNPILARGYDALNRGYLALARSNYESVLKADPKNTDALHGMAAIALRENQSTQAEQWFKQILVANPKDEAAMSGLIEIYGKANPAAAESRLKAIVAEHADATSPQVALGNLYSTQQRWQEAQHAYFAAYSTQPDNADVLFNLAISLEHLRQPRLARQYYTEALQAARRNPARFDTSVAEDRLSALAAQ